MFGQTPGEGLAKYVKDIKDQGLLQKYWSVWLPAQTLQFSVVPHHLQVAFLATVSFFWFMLFSHLSSKEGEVDEAPDAAAAEAEAVSAARLEVQVEQP
jgi:protein Mpv17